MNKKLLPLTLLELAKNDSIEGITRFQKLVFLAQRERLDRDYYRFVAGSYGPFSKTLYDDIDRLVREEFVENITESTSVPGDKDKQIYKLGPKGKRALQQGLEKTATSFSPDELEELVDHYNEMGLWDLLKYVYSKYPEMTENSRLSL